MATQTYEQLIAGANKIKENELPESNTHDIVGEQLLQMTNKMQEENSNNGKKFSELEESTNTKFSELKAENRNFTIVSNYDFPHILYLKVWSDTYKTLYLNNIIKSIEIENAIYVSFTYINDDAQKELRLTLSETDFTGVKTYFVKNDNVAVKFIIDWSKYEYLWRGFVNEPTVNNIGSFSDNDYISLFVNANNIQDLTGIVYPFVDVLKGSGIYDVYSELSENIYTSKETINSLNNAWICYNRVYNDDISITELSVFTYYRETTTTEVAKTLSFAVGSIDQRGWLINPVKYNMTQGVDYTIDFAYENERWQQITIKFNKYISIPKGCVLCINTNNQPESYMPMSGTSVISDLFLRSTTIDGVFANTYTPSYYTFKAYSVKRGYAKQDDLDTTNENIVLLNNKINESSIFTDVLTLEKYKIVVVNGQIQLKPLIYSNVAVLGASYITHGDNSSIGWVTGDGRGMAATIYDNDYPNSIVKGIRKINSKATGVRLGISDWEVNYDNFDFATWDTFCNKNPNLDLLIFETLGNSTYSETLENACYEMLSYWRNKYPTADILLTPSQNDGGKKANAMFRAGEKLTNCIECSLYAIYEESGFRHIMGDYYVDNNGDYRYITHTGVAGHYSDYGAILLANRNLISLGYDVINNYHDITININGNGNVAVCSNLGVVNGIITLHITSGNIKSINATDANGENVSLTLRNNEQNSGYNTYYTFIMPDSDVIVNVDFTL